MADRQRTKGQTMVYKMTFCSLKVTRT